MINTDIYGTRQAKKKGEASHLHLRTSALPSHTNTGQQEIQVAAVSLSSPSCYQVFPLCRYIYIDIRTVCTSVLGNGQLLCLNSRQSAVGRRLFCLLIAQIFAQALNAELMAERYGTAVTREYGRNINLNINAPT